MGQVNISPNPKVGIATNRDNKPIIIAPKIVEYSIPNGPKRAVKMIEVAMLFVGVPVVT